jgi:hypothetical protein
MGGTDHVKCKNEDNKEKKKIQFIIKICKKSGAIIAIRATGPNPIKLFTAVTSDAPP